MKSLGPSYENASTVTSIDGVFTVGANSTTGDFVVFTDTFDGTAINLTNYKVTQSTAGNISQNNTLSVVGNNAWTTNGITALAPLRRSNTLAMICDFTTNATSQATQIAMLGFTSSNTSLTYSNMPHALYLDAGVVGVYENGSSRGTFLSMASNTTYRFRIELASTGATYWYSTNGGDTWTLIYDGTGNNVTTSPLYWQVVGYGTTASTFDNLVLSNGYDQQYRSQLYDKNLTLGGVLDAKGGINTNGVLRISASGDVSGTNAAVKTNNLSDLSNVATARTNLGLGSLATLSTVTLTSNVTGLLPVANGGTGVGTLTGLVKGNGTSAMTVAVAGTDYVVPSGNITGTAANVTGTVALANGGTGATSAANARTNLGLGTLATLSTVALTSNVTGILPVANGGTGVSTLTGLVMANGTGAFTAAVANTDYATPSSVGLRMQFRGTWNSTASYAVNDVVVLSNLSGWVCTSANTNQTPASGSSYWTPLHAAGPTLGYQLVWNSGTSFSYTPDPGVLYLRIRMIGAGGGGGAATQGTSTRSVGGGGGSGSYLEAIITPPSGSTNFTVGLGGAGGTAPGGNGGNGGSTTFGSSLTAPGGQGGSGMAAVSSGQNAQGGAGGAAPTGGFISTPGSPGAPGVALSSAAAISGIGGSSAFGGGAQSRNTAGAGNNGTWGGGGSGGHATTTSYGGGNGGDGALIIEEFYY